MVPKHLRHNMTNQESAWIPCSFQVKYEDSMQIPEEWGCLEWLESRESLWNPDGMVHRKSRTGGVTCMSHLRVENCNTGHVICHMSQFPKKEIIYHLMRIFLGFKNILFT